MSLALLHGISGGFSCINRNRPVFLLNIIYNLDKMVFVYTGKGRRQAQSDDASPEQKQCAKHACAIQW